MKTTRRALSRGKPENRAVEICKRIFRIKANKRKTPGKLSPEGLSGFVLRLCYFAFINERIKGVVGIGAQPRYG